MRYSKLENPNKLLSEGNNAYLNIQGYRLVDNKSFQYYFSKNQIKFETSLIQKQLIKKMFYDSSHKTLLDLESIKYVRQKVSELVNIATEYNICFEASSILIFYNSQLKKANVKYVDFSYIPHLPKKFDYYGIDLFIDILDVINII